MELLNDLKTRQMAMMIFVCLEDPVKHQLLSKRFYMGILPNWFSQIKFKTLQVRLTEETGVSHVDLTEFEFPDVDYIECLTNAQKRTLHITGVS